MNNETFLIKNTYKCYNQLTINQMKKLLLNVDYTDSTRKFWFDSSIKKLTIDFDPEKQTIHELVKEVCAEQDGMEITYKGKPQGNIFRDNKTTGETEIVGYVYRGKSEIYDRNMVKPVMAFFDVWVTIKQIEKFEFETIDA
jgi:hypothetical protein